MNDHYIIKCLMFLCSVKTIFINTPNFQYFLVNM